MGTGAGIRDDTECRVALSAPVWGVVFALVLPQTPKDGAHPTKEEKARCVLRLLFPLSLVI